MENEERTYSPGKANNPGEVPRAFYSVSSGANPRLFPEAVHNMLPYHVAGYSLNCTSSYSTAGVHTGPQASGHMPAPSSALHVQQPAMALHSAPSSAVHAPAGAVGVLHGATGLSSQVTGPVGALLPPQASAGAFHTEASLVQPLVTQAAAIWPPGHAMPDVNQQQQQQNFQRLKVEDALSYLDQVKYQFSGQPQVYNDFLDIMKEFKSQSIDTPGVITRVSNLFRGHPDLIVGFNTFLPPGYKIEVQANETISVYQPGQQAISLAAFQGTSTLQPRPTHLNPNSTPVLTRPDLIPPPPASAPPSVPAPQSVGVLASNTPPAMAAAAVGVSSAGQPVEFNHAIQYVNKIKQCYHNQPEIYKSFLDILHQYQKEQKVLKEGNSFPPGYRPLSEIEVYTKVTELFKDQPQLLAEFSQFLPDAGSGSLMSGFGATAETSIARLRADHSASVSSKPFSSSSEPTGLASRALTQNLRRPSLVSGYQPPAKKRRDLIGDEDTNDASHLTNDDLLKKDSTGSQQLHALRSTDHLQRMRLLEHVNPMDKYGAEYDFSRNLPRSVSPCDDKVNNRKASYVVDLSTCKSEGPSYRQLPRSYVHPVCGGRTELCNEVLNDSYVLFPSDSKTQQKDAEDTEDKLDKSTVIGGAGSKKNQYEEHLFQCEDERYELDMILDLNNAAKCTLNNVSNRIKAMTQDETAKFRLDDKLGSNSEVLMQLSVSRLYGDNTRDVINGLKCNPAAAVPVVLKRLISKEKEWRDAQKEFNRVWREQNERFYLKSLDHQSTKFKQSDVKRIRSKSLLRDIEIIAETKKLDCKAADEVKDKQQPHMSLALHDPLIMTDAASLIEHHIRRQAGLQADDKTRIQYVMRTVLPQLLHFQPPAVAIDCNDIKDELDTNATKRVNNTEVSSNAKRNATSSSKLSWVKVEPVDQEFNGVETTNPTKSDLLFFCNDHWYFTLRLLLLLCDRLHYFHRLSKQLAEEEMRYHPIRNPLVQQALNLRSPNAMDMSESYTYLLDMVKLVLDGTLEVSTFEEQIRDVFGTHAYVAYTLDKLVQNVGRQLQHIVTKDACWQMIDVWESFNKLGSLATEYQKKVEDIVVDESCFKVLTNCEQNCVRIELIESAASSSSSCDENNIDPEHNDSADLPDDSNIQKPTFLSRNLRKVMVSKKKHTKEPTGHRLTWTTNEGLEEICLPTELQLINSTSTGGIVKYTCGALRRARQTHASVSRQMTTKFSRWLTEHWQSANVSAAQCESFRAWLLGQLDGLKPALITVSHQVAAQNDRPPYHSYVKYNVVVSDKPPTTSA